MNPTTPFWKQPHIYVTLLLMVPIYFIVWRVIGDDAKVFSETIKVMVITAMVSGALGAIIGFWLGTSQSSVKKDEAAAAITTQLAPPASPAAPAVGPAKPLPGAIPTGTQADPIAVTEVSPPA